MKKAFLKILQNSHKNIFVDVSLPINLQALKKLRHGCFAKPSKTPISKNIRRRRLLILFLMIYERNYPIRGKNNVLTNYWQITLSDVLTNYFIMHSKISREKVDSDTGVFMWRLLQTQTVVTWLKSTIETSQNCVKYVQI